MMQKIQSIYATIKNFIAGGFDDICKMLIIWAFCAIIFFGFGMLLPYVSPRVLKQLESFTGWLNVFLPIILYVSVWIGLGKLAESLRIEQAINPRDSLKSDQKLVKYMRWFSCPVGALSVLMYILYLWFDYGSPYPVEMAIGFSIMEAIQYVYDGALILTVINVGLIFYNVPRANKIDRLSGT